MDMYKKRKMRQEKKNNPNQNGSEKVQLNWLITIYLTPLSNPYK